jgi:hypothetical protein
MRENGVRSLAIRCDALGCNHDSILDVSAFANDVTVPSFGLRMVCTICGAIGADDARPNKSVSLLTSCSSLRFASPFSTLFALLPIATLVRRYVVYFLVAEFW